MNNDQQCTVTSPGHQLHWIQMRLAVRAWRIEGSFTAGQVLGFGSEAVVFGTDDEVRRLYHHDVPKIRAAVDEFGPEAVLLEQRVFVLLGAQQTMVFSPAASFSVAFEDARTACR